jgi:hypothetical protein
VIYKQHIAMTKEAATIAVVLSSSYCYYAAAVATVIVVDSWAEAVVLEATAAAVLF